MSSLAWRAAPIFLLTIRQFLGGKAIRVVVGLSAIPILFGIIYRIDPSIDRNARRFFGDTIFVNLMIPTMLPLIVLVLATAALGDEIEDRTLPFLILKPIARLRIVLEKLIGSVLISGPIAVAGLAITYYLVLRDAPGEHLRLLGAAVAATAAGTIAYSAIFMLVSTLISRALVAALVYSLIWESILGRWVPGLRYISIRHFVRSVFADISDDRRFRFNNATDLYDALATIAAASAIAIALTAWRLRRMNLE
jgi:ABC-2 type transport system permease protein